MTEYIGPNFTKPKNTYLTVAIGDEDDPTYLHVLPPTVGVLRGLQAALKYVEATRDGEADDSGLTLEDALEYVAAAMSHNADRVKVTAKQLDEMLFDIEDIATFIGIYTAFLAKLADGKN